MENEALPRLQMQAYNGVFVTDRRCRYRVCVPRSAYFMDVDLYEERNVGVRLLGCAKGGGDGDQCYTGEVRMF